MNFFFQQAKPLQKLLEREFRLCYNVPGFTHGALREMGSRDLAWFDARLFEELRTKEEDEHDAPPTSFRKTF